MTFRKRRWCGAKYGSMKVMSVAIRNMLPTAPAMAAALRDIVTPRGAVQSGVRSSRSSAARIPAWPVEFRRARIAWNGTRWCSSVVLFSQVSSGFPTAFVLLTMASDSCSINSVIRAWSISLFPVSRRSQAFQTSFFHRLGYRETMRGDPSPNLSAKYRPALRSPQVATSSGSIAYSYSIRTVRRLVP